jgi:hypothetical protein
MRQPTTETLDSERDRQELVDELRADHGADWSEQYQPGSHGCHELLDRTALMADLVERSVATHPACVRDPEWYALADRAVKALNELYQRVGAEHL